jgi:DNA topoisomerase IB
MNVFTGKSVDLPEDAEEVAGFYAALIESDHAKDETFNNNFFEDFLTVLKKSPPVSHHHVIFSTFMLIFCSIPEGRHEDYKVRIV